MGADPPWSVPLPPVPVGSAPTSVPDQEATVEDDIEVTVSVPETTDSDGDGVPDVVETGQALERATNAENDAADAQAAADTANVVADMALSTADQAETTAAANAAELAALRADVAELTTITTQLVEAMNAVAASQLADTQKVEPEPLPSEKDDPPESRHWFNRKLW